MSDMWIVLACYLLCRTSPVLEGLHLLNDLSLLKTTRRFGFEKLGFSDLGGLSFFMRRRAKMSAMRQPHDAQAR